MSDLRPDHRRRFRRLVAALNKLREDVAADFPDANYYLDDDTLNLMKGQSHADTPAASPQPWNVLDGARIVRSGGGGW